MKKLLQESFGTTEFFGENDLPATLPLQCVEDLEELEGKLKDTTLFEKMVSFLKLIGGRNGPDTTRRIMSRIICHRLAIKLNWSGRNEKPALKLFPHVVKLITACVRKNPMNKDFSTKQIEDQIKMWLRGAMDREGGRSERHKKNNVSIS